ncbi:hypothetical protein Pmani_026787 [Petrolisthes manimaculis]|uniref:THAP-type domain-containing protein n=1 Tax=Petrolisthes manimaculis TaxID=1843537 RepID=A0AAE1P4H5_9EUCA|nr:hypothetical protein Pmani_026787 [Petrolisthes manimaculis]
MEGRTHVCLICGNAKSTHPDFVYHRFPKENQRCNLWKSIVSIPRITEMTVEKLRRNYQICSRHFSPKHYMTGHFKSKLMHDAYPDQNLQSTGAAVLTKDSVVENSGYPGIEYQPRPHDGTLQAECAEVVDPKFGSLDVDSLRKLAGQTSPVMTESGENREVNRRGEPCITYPVHYTAETPVRHTAETPVRHTAETPVRHTAETPARHTAGTPARLGHPKITSSHIAPATKGLPKDPTRRQQWILAIGRGENYKPHSTSRLCSKHFKPEDFDRTSLMYVRLRDKVVPSIFEASSSHPQDNQETSPSNNVLMNTIKTELVESDNVFPNIAEDSSSHPMDIVKTELVESDNIEASSSHPMNAIIKTELVESDTDVPSNVEASSSHPMNAIIKTELVESDTDVPSNVEASSSHPMNAIIKTELVESDNVVPSNVEASSSHPMNAIIKTELVESDNVFPNIVEASSSHPMDIVKTELLESDTDVPSSDEDSSDCLQDYQKYSNGNASTKTLMGKLVKSENKVLALKKKVKMLQQQSRRLKKRNTKLSSIISAFNQKINGK